MTDALPLREQLCGADAIAAALEAGRPLRALFVREGTRSAEVEQVVAQCEQLGLPVRRAAEREMKRLAASREPVELLGLCGPSPEADLDEVLASGGPVWLLTGIAYAGNAGFAIRTAEVSGAAAIVVDADFDRTGRRQALRLSMRADRLFPVLFLSASETIAKARRAGYRVIGIEDAGTPAPWDEDLTGACLFVVGGEAEGVPRVQLEDCDVIIRIPMPGFMPSYNLQAAVAIVSGERLRQLTLATPG